MTDPQVLKATAQAAIDARGDWLVSAAEAIFANPELGFHEDATSRLVSEKLDELGIRHERGIALTGIKGYLRGGEDGPTVAIIGELDSLIQNPRQAEREQVIAGLNGNTKPSIQRYKGLGEMSANQLWESTMDPEKRTLLQVVEGDRASTDSTFSLLMGDVVEPRRNFIQSNALEVRNLDV